MTVGQDEYAVRCFTNNPSGKQHRYKAIALHLKTYGRPATFVDFDYQQTGLICRGQAYPLISMPWINGQTLDEFAYDNIGNAHVLEQLASEWYQAATQLQGLPIAHNDLQHGNVIVEPGNPPSIKLVDYDGLYVPQFANQHSPENGHRHYQHPARTTADYGPEIDNFPALVIYTSLVALARDPGASARRATSESLLFAQDDLKDPTNSKLFQYLGQSSDQQTAHLAKALSNAAKGLVTATPTLAQVSTQKATKTLPSWLTQTPPLPNTAPWTPPAPAASSRPTTQPPPGTSPAPQDPAQRNRNLIDEELQKIGRDLKPAVIKYALQMQQEGWTFRNVKGTAGNHIGSVKDLENSGPDATALAGVLLAILDYRQNDPLSNFGMSKANVVRMRNIRNDHAHSRVDFSDQDYVDRTLQTLRNFRQSIDRLPQTLPGSQRSNQGRNPQRGNRGRNPQNRPYGQSHRPRNQAGSQRNRRQPQQNPTPAPAVPTHNPHPTLERLLAQCFLVSTVFSVTLVTLLISQRISMEDLSMVLIGVVVMMGSGFWLWKTSDDPVGKVGQELQKAAILAATLAKRAFQATAKIQDRRIRWAVRIAPIVVLAGAAIYLYTPTNVASTLDSDTVKYWMELPNTQVSQPSLPTRRIQVMPQVAMVPTPSTHDTLPHAVAVPTPSTYGILPGTCQQTEVGHTVCIGNQEGQPERPPHIVDDGRPLQASLCVAVGTENDCLDWIQDTPAGLQFLDIQKGNSRACGITTDETIVCWGADVQNQLDAPPGEFVALTTGGSHSCALRHNGTTECWGDNTFNQLATPPNRFKEISAGGNSTCGIDYDNALVCWGNEWEYRSAPIGTTELTTVSSGGNHTCGLRADGTPTCWGGNKPENNVAPAVKLVSINAGYENTCGMMTDGNAVCWGENEHGETQVPPGKFTDIQTDGSRTCGLRPDGSIECWGWALEPDHRKRTPPGPYRTFRIDGATCGIRFDGTASCWSTQQFTTLTEIVGGIGIETGDYFVECEPGGYVSYFSSDRSRAGTTIGGTTFTVTDGDEIVISKCELKRETP
ncbi:MAG: hypothetical protein OXF79_28665 [Chloroflexi bacterium]|nr:hypothetical protein [Chloroflexota bacterium]